MPKTVSRLPLILLASFASLLSADDSSEKPIRALIITGGCGHAYGFQTKAMQQAAYDRNLDVARTAVKDGGNGTDAQLSNYGQPRVFGTTYGHSNKAFADEVFLTTLARSIQWAAGRLGK